MNGPCAISRTFQLIAGVGPWRENDLWQHQIHTWDDFEAALRIAPVLSAEDDRQMMLAIETAREALARRDLMNLARLIPKREWWRLCETFSETSAFIDVECDAAGEISILGVSDATGFRSYRADCDLENAAMQLQQRSLWITFHGATFDVPKLQRIQGKPSPMVHVDLRFLTGRLGFRGGLKRIETEMGLNRPQHIQDVDGAGAISLWSMWHDDGDRHALEKLIEYNFYDVVHLRQILQLGIEHMCDRNGWRP